MNKQKQIEEMADIICMAAIAYQGEKKEHIRGTQGAIAESLYNAGYRKIPENAVVLTDDEYERWQGQTLNIKKVRKETAEKFAEMVKGRTYHGQVNIYDFEVDEICKELTEGE